MLVDNVDPSLSFTSGPANGSVIAYGSTVSFKFSAVDATSQISFQCAYDKAALASCASPTPATTLPPGRHGFRVVGTDALGNSSTIQRVFKVGAQPRCQVPHLRGLTLAQARVKLHRVHCTLGPVRRPPRAVLQLPINRGQTLVVQRQAERPGASKPNGQPVGIALVPRRDLKLG